MLDNLIPKQILDACEFDRCKVYLELTATSARNEWPTVRFKVANVIVYQGPVEGSRIIEYDSRLSIKECQFDLEYYGKENKHTVVDQGQLVENQAVTISKFEINDIDIIKTNLIYSLGNYQMKLSPEKTAYFVEHNIPTGPSHSLYMSENGNWILNVTMPLVTHFVRCKTYYEPHAELWPDIKLLNDIYNTVNNIRRLESLIDDNDYHLRHDQ